MVAKYETVKNNGTKNILQTVAATTFLNFEVKERAENKQQKLYTKNYFESCYNVLYVIKKIQ
jgi:hypothetical protein